MESYRHGHRAFNPENTLMIKSKTSYLSHGVSFNKYLLNTCYVPGSVWVLEVTKEQHYRSLPSWNVYLLLQVLSKKRTFPKPEPYAHSVPNFNSLDKKILNNEELLRRADFQSLEEFYLCFMCCSEKDNNQIKLLLAQKDPFCEAPWILAHFTTHSPDCLRSHRVAYTLTGTLDFSQK